MPQMLTPSARDKLNRVGPSMATYCMNKQHLNQPEHLDAVRYSVTQPFQPSAEAEGVQVSALLSGLGHSRCKSHQPQEYPKPETLDVAFLLLTEMWMSNAVNEISNINSDRDSLCVLPAVLA